MGMSPTVRRSGGRGLGHHGERAAKPLDGAGGRLPCCGWLPGSY